MTFHSVEFLPDYFMTKDCFAAFSISWPVVLICIFLLCFQIHQIFNNTYHHWWVWGSCPVPGHTPVWRHSCWRSHQGRSNTGWRGLDKRGIKRFRIFSKVSGGTVSVLWMWTHLPWSCSWDKKCWINIII